MGCISSKSVISEARLGGGREKRDSTSAVAPTQPQSPAVETKPQEGQVASEPSSIQPQALAAMINGVSRETWDVTSLVKKSNPKPVRSGGFSDVYEGIMQPGGHKVAIKCLRAVNIGGLSPDSPEVHNRLDKRLLREMRVWKTLNHARILPCLGYATLDGMPCLISPWCSKGNISEYIRSNPTCDRKALIFQVAEGLVYLHAQDPAIVHHDVKSPNILIGDDGKAMLTDFGVAKILEETKTGLTTSNATALTIRTSSPEALEGRIRDVKSDVYSFACFSLETITGKVPFFELRIPSSIVAAKFKGTLPAIDQFPELPPTDPLWGLLARCWNQDPTQRPTMTEVLDELTQIGYKA